LIEATLAYATGDAAKAAEEFAAIEPRALPPSLAGQAALVKATVIMDGDPNEALALLDFARLLMPGTLVEEAALRRGVALAGMLKDAQRFERLAGQYLRRFPHSAYAGGFHQQFAAGFVAIGAAEHDQTIERLRVLLADLPPAARGEVYLAIAREAMLAGLTHTARFAADQAIVLTAPASAELARAQLFGGAMRAASVEAAAGTVMLTAVDAQKLGPAEAELLAAALRVAEDVQRPTPPATASVATVEAAFAPDEAGRGLVERARQAIAAADQLLATAQ
jgi:chemotaxis protein MotC